VNGKRCIFANKIYVAMKFTNEILLLLRQYKSKAMSQCGPTRFGVFGVFGSVARGEQTDRNICLIF
jgi:hypothetical protein